MIIQRVSTSQRQLNLFQHIIILAGRFLPLPDARMIPFVALLALCSPALASILAIDYGADTMKVALMKPGVPFDVVLDRDSKRKIASVVGWKGEDRLFGQDGRNLVRALLLSLLMPSSSCVSL
jgi:hypothetical protein